MKTDAKIVARYTDGRILKGTTSNFDPTRSTFLLRQIETDPLSEPIPVRLRDLKAVFFVKDFSGNSEYVEAKSFAAPVAGRRMAVRFLDGETLVGVSLTYDESRDGFFVFPADRDSNNLRVYVMRHSVLTVDRAA
jgi:small nuclear ribonucleoprotein (snRNP)-like protein